MNLRQFKPSDIEAITQLFHDTIHSINIQDYSLDQVNAWAPNSIDRTKWLTSLSKNHSYIVEHEGIIIGFADMTTLGYINRLFVHKNYQRQGIATKLLKKLESIARQLALNELTTEASITARPFFEHHGFKVIEQQEVVKRGVSLTNFEMKKVIAKKTPMSSYEKNETDT